MPTLFIDYEGGNDNHGGTSFALLASGADGALTAGGAFSSATASFPNDGSLIDQYLSIFNGTIYAVYRITAWVSSTALTVVAITGGTALAALTARQYFIGGRWKTVNIGATAVRTIPGDNIRIKATSSPSLVGNATWTGGLKPGSRAITSSTNATPIVITSTGHGFVTGDYITVSGHNTNTNANGVWRVGTVPTANTFQILQLDGSNTTGNGVGSSGSAQQINKAIVKLASPVTQNIALCGGLGQKPNWTAATANVTCTQNLTNYKEGYSAAQIAVNATFTTGKAAYYTLPSTLDLSAYQQVAFWVNQTAGSTGSTHGYIALCTDTLGDVVAHTCTIPPLTNSNAWNPITVDLGVNLNSAIRSVAFYVTLDNGAQTTVLDNIIACKAASSDDSLTLSSVFSKSDGTGVEAWYSAQFINSNVVMIANANNITPDNFLQLGYSGTTETVATYKIEPVKPLGNANNVAQGVIPNESGTAGNPISYSGGWNRTDMSTQIGQTWLDGSNGNASGVAPSSRSFLNIDRMNVVRYAQGYNLLSSISFFNIGSIYATCCGAGVNFNGTITDTTIGNIWASNCNNQSVGGINISGARGVTVGNIYSLNNPLGMNMGGADVTIESVTISNSNTAGFATNGTFNWLIKTVSITNCVGVPAMTMSGSANFVIGGGSTSGNGSGITQGSAAYPTQVYLNNFTINEATEVSISASFFGQMYVYSNRHDNTDNNSWVYQGIGTVNQQTAIVDSPATTAWLMRPTSTSATALFPLRLKLGTIVCAANTLVTVTARMRRSNTGLTMRLECPGGQISGVPSEVFTDMTAAADTWQTVTITFTPTKAGGVDIYAYAFGGTTFSGYVCNLTASQA